MINLKRYLKIFLRDSISFLLYLLMAWKKREGTVVLVYHSVDRIDPSSDTYRINITPEKFEEHLKVILKSKECVRITFDDGYGNNFENAFPLLKRYGCTATIFLITDFIEGAIRSNVFCGEGLGLRPLTWEEIKAMDRAGIIIGSHTRSHPMLAALSRDAVREELLDSKQRIESMLGHPISSFSYPFGNSSSFNDLVMKAVAEAGYIYAYSNIMGVNIDDSQNRYSLRRVRIYSEDGTFRLKMKLRGAYDWIDKIS